MFMAISKLLPRMFHKKVRTKTLNGNSAALSEECSTEKELVCRVVLLDDSELLVNFKVNAKGQFVLDHVFDHLGIVEKDYFGLSYCDVSMQTKWLNVSKTVVSQIHCGADGYYQLCFGVKFYAADPCKLFEEITRYQFFLQVKHDIMVGRLSVDADLAAELAAYAVQSELGDYDPDTHLPGYTSEFEFLPNQSEQFEEQVALLHRNLVGQVPARAEYSYLDRVKWLDMYGVVLHPVQGDGHVDYLLGIAPTGVIIYRNKVKVCNHFWPRILKVSCRSKVFIIRVRDKNNIENTWSFDCQSKQSAKELCKCCSEHFLFYRQISATNSYEASSRLFVTGTRNIHTRALSSDTSHNNSQTSFVRQPSRRRQRRLSSGTDDYLSIPQTGSSYLLDHHDIGCDSPTSVRSEFCPRRTYCTSEAGSVHHRSRRHHHRCRDMSSLNSTLVSSSSRRHRYMTDADTDSECESVYLRRSHYDDRSIVDVRHTCLTDADDYDTDVTQSYIRSRHGSMSSVVSAPETHSHRRRRRQSRSPGYRPPRELAEHFRYVDLMDEQLHTVPYTCVKTDTEICSPRTRRRLRQRQHKSVVGQMSDRSRLAWLPAGEPPPPYIDPAARHPELHDTSARFHHHSHRVVPVDNLQFPMAVHVTQVYTAPIVKIKALCDGTVQLDDGSSSSTSAETDKLASVNIPQISDMNASHRQMSALDVDADREPQHVNTMSQMPTVMYPWTSSDQEIRDGEHELLEYLSNNHSQSSNLGTDNKQYRSHHITEYHSGHYRLPFHSGGTVNL